MTCEEMINDLRRLAPVLTHVTGTYDMGYEFSAVVPAGVIYAEPGMLLNFSGGEWPPNQWENKTDEECAKLLKKLLLGDQWRVTVWEDLTDAELELWLGAAKTALDL